MSHEIDRSHPTSQPINSMLRCPGLGGLHYAFSLEQKTGERHYVIFADDNRIPAHWHPAIEHVTMISGTFHMGTGDKLDPSHTKALSAGSVAIMPPKTNHVAWTNEETVVHVHGVGPWAITYVNPADDPRKP
jgi:quercetin dioxygenase-like cupin family protein